MTGSERTARLAELSQRAGEAAGWEVGRIWREYELVRDGGRDRDELIAEGLALSRVALELAAHAESAGT